MMHKIIKRKPQANLNPSIIFEIEYDGLLKDCLSLRRSKKKGFLIFKKNFELPRIVATFNDRNVDSMIVMWTVPAQKLLVIKTH